MDTTALKRRRPRLKRLPGRMNRALKRRRSRVAGEVPLAVFHPRASGRISYDFVT